MIRALIGYARGDGQDARWSGVELDRATGVLRRRLYHRLYGSPGDGGGLEEPERMRIESVGDALGHAFAQVARPGDFVFVHDSSFVGLIPRAKELGMRVIWRSHIGTLNAGDLEREAWAFLRPYVEPADAFVYEDRRLAWDWHDRERVHGVAPSIDPFSAKNKTLSAETVEAILVEAGVATDGTEAEPVFDAGGEERAVWAELRGLRRALAPEMRRRIHLVQLPIEDLDENAAMVNAIQRRADVIVHASHEEGFSLAVAEAMWKEKAVVATRVGGLAEQIADERSGVLVAPRDPDAIGEAIARLLAEPNLRSSLGAEAHRQVATRYLPVRHLSEYVDVIEEVCAGAQVRR